MKIIELYAENIKKLKAVNIKPQSDVVLITGSNGAGKTSVLDAIMYALCGKDSIPPKPIRDGEKSAMVKIDLGEYIVKRVFTENSSYLEITNKEGFKASSPQTLLDSVVGKLAFDPLEFANMKPVQQREYLMQICGISTNDLDKQIAETYVARTAANQEVKRLQGAYLSLETVAPKEKPELIDTDEILARISEIKNLQAQAMIAQNEVQIAEQTLHDISDNIGRIMKEIVEYQEKIRLLNLRLDEMYQMKKDLELEKEAKLEKASEFANDNFEAELQELNTKLKLANNRREEYFRWEQLQAKNEELHHANKRYLDLDAKIEQLRQQKKSLLENVKMPIEGLAFSDDGLTYNGIPLEQVNEAEQIRISLAVAMAMNPTLKVIRIANGSALGTKMLAEIEKMANLQDYQVWIEKMDETGTVGIVIEEGEVVKINA